MQLRRMTVLWFIALGGCAWLTGSQTFGVYFEPYSATVDQQARQTIEDAAQFARAHPLQPVLVAGYAAPPDPKRDVEGLSEQRAEAVKQMLVAAGVSPLRINTEANGITDPNGLPSVAVRRVDISVGPPGAR